MKKSMTSVGQYVESIMPDEKAREWKLSLFADSIEYLHRRNPQIWGCYCNYGSHDSLRLLAGSFIIMTVHSDFIWLSLDKATLEGSGDQRSRLEAAAGWHFDVNDRPGGYPEYKRIPSRNIYYRPGSGEDQSWPAIRDLHYSYLDRITARYLELSLPSQKKHQSELVDYLRTFLKRSLPDPGWFSTCPPISMIEVDKYIMEKGDFDVSSIEDARLKANRSIVLRQGQRPFRRQILQNYGNRCVFSGSMVTDVLDAAHIHPYKGEQTNNPRNGLLLRTDLHTLFDLGLLAVETANLTILVADSLRGTEYWSFNGKRLELPAEPDRRPSLEALEYHRQNIFKAG